MIYVMSSLSLLIFVCLFVAVFQEYVVTLTQTSILATQEGEPEPEPEVVPGSPSLFDGDISEIHVICR